jgi:pimeloyl-ACP methyl ester carboxylesterase
LPIHKEIIGIKTMSTTENKKGKYAKVNSLNLYYEVYGTGKPMVLIHGGLGVTGMFEQLVPSLSEIRQILAVELQGHGHTADVERPFSFEGMADDVAAFIQHLGLGTSDILGYSLGGGVALQTAIRHPDSVGKLVIVSSVYKSEGWYPEVLAGMRSINAETGKTWIGSPMQQAYASVAPKPEDWPKLVAKTGDLLRGDYDWSREVSALQNPTMIVVGDADAVRTAHAVQFFESLGGGKREGGWDGSGMSKARLAILPATTHYNILTSPLLAATVRSFLENQMPEVMD